MRRALALAAVLLLGAPALADPQATGLEYTAPAAPAPPDIGGLVLHRKLPTEKKYGFDFDAGLTSERRAAAWAAEKMCEDHL